MEQFSGKVAAITGAGSGIGRGLALELAAEGCHLALSDVDDAGLAGTVAMIARATGDRGSARAGVKVSSARVDVVDREAVDAWAASIVDEFGQVNLIFNNAGVALSANVSVMTYESFRWLMDINFWGVVHGVRSFLPHLAVAGQGHIVNTASMAGLSAWPGIGPYNASKYAVVGISESAASHQLRLLRAHRLVTFRKEGRIAYYRLLDQHINGLIGSAVDHVRE
jgi:NAD(P)-dependent dehydrogenase (short-subunit alcohol dehydrogenase family)